MSVEIKNGRFKSVRISMVQSPQPPQPPPFDINVVAPTYWNEGPTQPSYEGPSGYATATTVYSSGGDTVTSMAAAVSVPLSSYWNNLTPLAYDTNYSGLVPFFVPNSPIIGVTRVRIDANTDSTPPGDPPAMVWWDSSGNRNTSLLFTAPILIQDLGNGRAIYEFALPTATTLTGVSFLGFGGYPFGRPRILYGVEILTDPLPAASFTFSTQFVTAGSPVTFTDTSSMQPISWLWDFGDGNTSTLQNPVHSWLTPGPLGNPYIVTLVATNAAGTGSPGSAEIFVSQPG